MKLTFSHAFSDRDISRFWSKVKIGNIADCWPWIAAKRGKGYGVFYSNGKLWVASRAAYIISTNSANNFDLVCHKCDNPSCCNPHHLFSGTAKDNTHDMIKKGRMALGLKHGSYTKPASRTFGDKNGARLHPERLLRGENHRSKTHPWTILKGENHPTAKLTNRQIVEIRRLLAEGLTQLEISKKTCVCRTTISRIKTKKLWRHI